jgi:hypothetical protein
MMGPAVLEDWMMTILVTVLVGFMAFIVWDLAKNPGLADSVPSSFFSCLAWESWSS